MADRGCCGEKTAPVCLPPGCCFARAPAMLAYWRRLVCLLSLVVSLQARRYCHVASIVAIACSLQNLVQAMHFPLHFQTAYAHSCSLPADAVTASLNFC